MAVRSTKKKTAKAVKKSTTKKAAKTAKKSTKKKATKKKVTKKATTKAIKKATKKVTRESVKKTIRKTVKPTVSVVATPALTVGDMMPDVIREATGGKSLSLADLRGRKVVLYFYPKDDTPGCTLEGQDFTRLHQQFTDANCEILGVSRDSVASHEKFCSKFAFTFTLLSDEDEQLCNAFGVIKDKNMYGKMVKGIERSTFVIDASGKLSREWRKVSVEGHAQEVLDYVRNLG